MVYYTFIVIIHDALAKYYPKWYRISVDYPWIGDLSEDRR